MDCVVINGYFPSLTIKSVLNTITEEILATEDTFSSNTEHVAHILRYVEPEPQAFILAGPEPDFFPVPEPDLDPDPS